MGRPLVQRFASGMGPVGLHLIGSAVPGVCTDANRRLQTGTLRIFAGFGALLEGVWVTPSGCHPGSSAGSTIV